MFVELLEATVSSICFYKLYKKALTTIMNDTEYLIDIINERYSAYGNEITSMALMEANKLENNGDWQTACEYYLYALKVLKAEFNTVINIVKDEKIKEIIINEMKNLI